MANPYILDLISTEEYREEYPEDDSVDTKLISRNIQKSQRLIYKAIGIFNGFFPHNIEELNQMLDHCKDYLKNAIIAETHFLIVNFPDDGSPQSKILQNILNGSTSINGYSQSTGGFSPESVAIINELYYSLCEEASFYLQKLGWFDFAWGLDGAKWSDFYKSTFIPPNPPGPVILSAKLNDVDLLTKRNTTIGVNDPTRDINLILDLPDPEDLAKTSLNNLTSEGEAHFAKPSDVTDAITTAEAFTTSKLESYSTSSEVNSEIATSASQTLSSAKTYADGVGETTLASAKDYTDTSLAGWDDNKWCGVVDVLPTQRSDGSPLKDGDYCFLTTDECLYFYDLQSTNWQSAGSPVDLADYYTKEEMDVRINCICHPNNPDLHLSTIVGAITQFGPTDLIPNQGYENIAVRSGSLVFDSRGSFGFIEDMRDIAGILVPEVRTVYTPSNFDTNVVHTLGAETIRGSKTFMDDMSMGLKGIHKMADPIDITDATTKNYVDSLLSLNITEKLVYSNQGSVNTNWNGKTVIQWLQSQPNMIDLSLGRFRVEFNFHLDNVGASSISFEFNSIVGNAELLWKSMGTALVIQANTNIVVCYWSCNSSPVAQNKKVTNMSEAITDANNNLIIAGSYGNGNQTQVSITTYWPAELKIYQINPVVSIPSPNKCNLLQKHYLSTIDFFNDFHDELALNPPTKMLYAVVFDANIDLAGRRIATITLTDSTLPKITQAASTGTLVEANEIYYFNWVATDDLNLKLRFINYTGMMGTGSIFEGEHIYWTLTKNSSGFLSNEVNAQDTDSQLTATFQIISCASYSPNPMPGFTIFYFDFNPNAYLLEQQNKSCEIQTPDGSWTRLKHTDLELATILCNNGDSQTNLTFTLLDGTTASLAKWIITGIKFANDGTLINIGDNFCYQLDNLTSLITKNTNSFIPDSVTSIGNNFFGDCTIFNQNIAFPKSLVSIGNTFLQMCMNFNKNIVLPKSLVSIGDGFLINCNAFNQNLALPDSLISIGASFMAYNATFNQLLILPSALITIGALFLLGCTSYNNFIYCPGNESKPNAWSTDRPFQNCIAPTSWDDKNILWNQLPSQNKS